MPSKYEDKHLRKIELLKKKKESGLTLTEAWELSIIELELEKEILVSTNS